MESGTAINSSMLHWSDLKSLCAARGPCITISLPAFYHGAKALPYSTNLKSAVRIAEEALLKKGLPEDAKVLLPPLQTMAEELANTTSHRARIIFESPGVFRHSCLPDAVPFRTVVGPYFHILPILDQLCVARDFFILGLSEKHLRLLHYCDGQCEELPIPDELPKNAQDAGEFDPPDHTLRDASPAGRSPGVRSAVIFGTGSEREKGRGRLREFFRIIDCGLSKSLARKPLLLSGVDYEVDAYRAESTYAYLMEGALDRDLHDLPAGDVARRASEFARIQAGQYAERQLRLLKEMSRTERTSFNLDRIHQAAGEGRVEKLILAVPEEATIGGSTEFELEGRQALLNAAAVLSIRHGAEIFLLQTGTMARSSPLAAIFRY